MDINDTAYNEYVLCSDCESGSANVTFGTEYTCPMWSMEVKNVGLCKHYRKLKAEVVDGNSED